jgi:hypothetical protein
MSTTALTLLIGGDISRLRAEMAKASGLMNGFSSQIQGIGHQMGLTFGTVGIFMGLKHGLNVIKDFEKAMSEVRAITNATDGEFKALRDSALELGRTTKFTAQEVAQLQVALGRLGFSNTEIIDSTAAILKLSVATGEDLAKSGDIAGATLRAFNLEAKEMQRVVDVMTSSFNKSALGLDNFGESMKFVAPVAAAAGISIEETTAMLGVLADAGIRGSLAGTSLRKIISDVGGESGTLTEKLESLAAKGLTGADAMDEVGRTAYASLLILANHTDKVNEAAEAYRNAAGESDKMAEKMEDNLAGDITKLTSALDGFILKFSEGAGAVRELTQALTELVGFFSDNASFFKKWFELATTVPRLALKLPGIIKNSWFPGAGNTKEGFWDGTVNGKGDNPLFDQFGSNPSKPTPGFSIFPAGAQINQATAAVDKYRESYKKLLDLVKFETPKAGRGDISDGGKDLFHPNINMDPTSSLLSRNERENPVEGIVKEAEANDQLAVSLQNINKLKQEQLDKMHATADMAVTMGDAIGEAFNAMIKGEQNFAQALAKITEQIITLYLQQSIAAMIRSAIEDKTTDAVPFAKIAVAAAGIGAVKALFGQIGGAGGSGGGGSSAPGRTPSEMRHSIGGRIRGYDLELVGENNSYRRGWTG